jgi:hypothetical protein
MSAPIRPHCDRTAFDMSFQDGAKNFEGGVGATTERKSGQIQATRSEGLLTSGVPLPVQLENGDPLFDVVQIQLCPLDAHDPRCVNDLTPGLSFLRSPELRDQHVLCARRVKPGSGDLNELSTRKPRRIEWRVLSENEVNFPKRRVVDHIEL